jgi:nitroreductase
MNYDDFFGIAEGRRSVRSYLDKRVGALDIERILLAGIQAPSATNVQGWKFRIIDNKQLIDKISLVIKNKVQSYSDKLGDGIVKNSFLEYSKNFYFFKTAPVLIVVYAKEPTIIVKRYFAGNADVAAGIYQSIGMVMQNIMLSAHTLHLSTCVLTGSSFALDEIEKIIATPKYYKFGGFICLGYPKTIPKSPGRMELNEFIVKD